MAIQEFSSGPQNYFEPGYFNGDYTEPNVSRAFLECDVDNIKGGRVVTGEYYLGNYIDGTYYHNNSSKATVTVTADKIINGNASLQDYFEPGYFVNGYIEPRSAKATVSCQSTRIRNTTAAFVSEFQQTTQARLITDINLFAFGDAAITVQVSRIRDTNINASSVFNVATDFVVERSADADVDAIFSAIIAGLRSRDFNLETQAAFSFVASTGVVKQTSSSVSAQAQIVTEAQRLRNIDCAQSTSSSLTVTAIKIKSLQADLSAVCSVSAAARKIRDAHLTGTGVAALTCSASFSGVFSAQLQNNAVITANVGKQTSAASALTAFSSVNVSRRVGQFARPITIDDPLGRTVFSDTFVKYGSHAATANGFVIQTTANAQIRVNNQFVCEGWHYRQSGLTSTRTLMAIGATGTAGSNETSVGDNQWILVARVRQLNNATLLSMRLLVKNNLNQTQFFDSQESNDPNLYNAWMPTGTGYAHWAVTRNSAGLMQVFKNGSQIISGTVTTMGTASEYRAIFADNETQTFISRWDELSLRRDTSGVTQAQQTNQPETQVFLFHLDNNLNDDTSNTFNVTFSMAAVLSSTATVSAQLSGPVRASSTLVSTSLLQATISHIEGADLVAFANSTIVVNADKLRIAAANVSAVSNISTTVVKTANAVSNIADSSNLTANLARTRSLSADFTALASQLTAAIRIRGLLVDDLSEFVINASVNKIGSAVSAVSASSNLQSTAVKIKQLDSALTAQATLSAVGVSAKLFSATTSSAFAISTTANRLRSSAISVVSNTQLSAVGNNLGKIESALFNSASVTANINKTANAITSISVVSTVNAVVARTRDTASFVNSSTAIIADAQRVTTASAVFATVASQLSVAVEISGLQASMVTAVTLTADATRTRNFTANTATISQLTGAIGKNISLSAALTASSTCTINAGRSVSAQINIQSAMQFVAEVREIRLDNIVYVIPSETRVYVIKGETRIHRIREETRIYTI